MISIDFVIRFTQGALNFLESGHEIVNELANGYAYLKAAKRRLIQWIGTLRPL